MSWHFLTKQLIIFAQELFLALYGEKIEMRSIWPNFERHVVLIFMQYVYILLTHTGYIFECTHSVILFLRMNVKLLFWTNQNLYWIRERRWFMVQTSHIGIRKHYLDSGHTGIYYKVVVFFTIQFFFLEFEVWSCDYFYTILNA